MDTSIKKRLCRMYVCTMYHLLPTWLTHVRTFVDYKLLSSILPVGKRVFWNMWMGHIWIFQNQLKLTTTLRPLQCWDQQVKSNEMDILTITVFTKIFVFYLWMFLTTPPRPSEISMKNWKAMVKPVLTFHFWYKAMLKVWRKLWEPFRIYP